MKALAKIASEFWGLNDKNFKFYDEQGKPIQDTNDDGSDSIVDKHFEGSGAKSSSGPKVAVLCLASEKNADELVLAYKSKDKMRNKNLAE